MHDLLLAKEIIKNLENILKEKKIKKIKNASIEIGNIFMSHDDHPDHAEEINIDNLKFGLKSISNGTKLENCDFKIKKIFGSDWKISKIEVE